MMSEADFERMLTFFKIMGNENRLRIVGMLAGGGCTVRELAERLHLKEPTVSEHLTMLRELGIVTYTQRGNFRVYAFDPEPLRLLSKEVLSQERLAAWAPPAHADQPASLDITAPLADEAQQAILRRYLKAGRLTQIPNQRRNLLIILKWLSRLFAEGERYTEREVNEAIKRYHEDYATLRRELIDFHFMDRANNIYWRTPETEPVIG